MWHCSSVPLWDEPAAIIWRRPELRRMPQIGEISMWNRKSVTVCIAAIAVAGFTAAQASAAWIIPTGAFASSEQPGNGAAIQAIDGVHLTAESTAGLHNAAANSSWSMQQGGGGNVQDEYITLDLGDFYDLTDLHVWQFTRNSTGNDANRSVKIFDVLVSTDGVFFTEVLSDLSLTKAIDVAPANGLPDGGEPVQSFSLVQSNVRYVQLGVDLTYENNGTKDWQGGFGEVRFEGTLVPEPASMALIGLGGLLMARRRRD
jgi:hypothetical protein